MLRQPLDHPFRQAGAVIPTLEQAKNDKTLILRQLLMFTDVEEPVLSALADDATYVEMDRDTRFIRQGQKPNKLYVIVSGMVSIRRDADGKAYYLPFRGHGAIIGSSILTGEELHAHDVRTVMPTQILEISAHSFHECFRNSRYLQRNIIKELKRHFYKYADDAQIPLHIESKPARAVIELLQICEALKYPCIAEDFPVYPIRIDWLHRETWAKRLGLDNKTLSPALTWLTTPWSAVEHRIRKKNFPPGELATRMEQARPFRYEPSIVAYGDKAGELVIDKEGEKKLALLVRYLHDQESVKQQELSIAIDAMVREQWPDRNDAVR